MQSMPLSCREVENPLCATHRLHQMFNSACTHVATAQPDHFCRQALPGNLLSRGSSDRRPSTPINRHCSPS